jgi:triacylglycerol lipase
MLLLLTHLIIRIFDGDNDGIVSVASARWGEYKGVITSKGIRGVSHIDIVDGRRMRVGDIDIRDIYVDIVKELREKGF